METGQPRYSILLWRSQVQIHDKARSRPRARELSLELGQRTAWSFVLGRGGLEQSTSWVEEGWSRARLGQRRHWSRAQPGQRRRWSRAHGLEEGSVEERTTRAEEALERTAWRRGSLEECTAWRRGSLEERIAWRRARPGGGRPGGARWSGLEGLTGAAWRRRSLA